MAGTWVGESFLSWTMEALLDTCRSPDFKESCRERKLNVLLLDELKETLDHLGAVLKSAEERANTDPSVAVWLDELCDVVLDAEDLSDEIITASAQRKAETKRQNFTITVRDILFSPSKKYGRVMDSKIKAICQRLEYFVREGEFHLQIIRDRRVTLRMPATSLVDESFVVGRIDDKEKLMNMLLSDDDAQGGNVGVVTIVGRGGVGKTTLAQLLYSDKRVQKHFDQKAWVCLSDEYTVREVTKTLLESLTLGAPYDSSNNHYVPAELNQTLRDKRFLIVLDNLWSNEYICTIDWFNFKIPFANAKTGSRFIITTRQQVVAELTHTFPIYKLEPLSDKDCWSLLARHAFEGEDPSRYPNLEVIGKRIAIECNGLPIAAKVLGGLLRSKVFLEDWKIILNSYKWGITSDGWRITSDGAQLPRSAFNNYEIRDALGWSYLFVPTHLKRCFVYCSRFPKGYLFDKKQLVLLWMAEGLVQEFKGKKPMEEIVDGYFSELLSRSLIQHADGGMFVLDARVSDLAATLYSKSVLYSEGNRIPSNVRHLSYHIGEYDSSEKFSTFFRLKYLRSFVPLSSNHGLKQCYLAKMVLYDLLPTLRCLRVLSLSQYCNITELPSSIGNLVHLRYLDLSCTAIKRLPDAACALYNLQTLLLSKCEFLIELPTNIGKLANLRHLDITGTNLKSMPAQITELQNLRTLTTFVVGKQHDGLSIRELRNFPHLQGKLSILKLQNVVDATDASEANLMNKAQIEELTLEWSSNEVYDTLLPRNVLDLLLPSTNLRSLTISYYGGTSLSSWLGDYSYINIVSLCINQCKQCRVLPPFGQLPSLKKLEIKGMASINTVGVEFYGRRSSSFKPFPVLESLTFMCMSEWEEWIPFEGKGENVAFPCLERLCLIKCPKLRGYLPNHLPTSMIEVEISHCDQLEALALCKVSLIENLSIVNGRLDSFMLLENDSQFSVSHLNIKMCDSLPSLPEMFLSNNCLHHLCLNFVPSLISFPMDGLPSSLRSLKIWECKKLKFLPHETLSNYKSLERLELCNSCHSIISFPLGSFPALKYLEIISSPKLELFTISETSAYHLLHLETLEISDCPNLESFPLGGLCTPNLIKLSISHCDRLKSLPGCIVTLSALQDCTFSNLPSLTSFPLGGLPSNLRSLIISDIERLSPISIAGLGFQRLTSLSQVRVGGQRGDDLLKAFMENHVLSMSLVSLSICNLSYLRFFEGYWLQQFTSLQKLQIENCPRLESLPEDSLPLSLKFVSIFCCPILEARYQDRGQENWSKIAHIPVIVINEEVII